MSTVLEFTPCPECEHDFDIDHRRVATNIIYCVIDGCGCSFQVDLEPAEESSN